MINKIEDKKTEIANYERILAAYVGRWYDQGRRHLEDLKADLEKLRGDDCGGPSASLKS